MSSLAREPRAHPLLGWETWRLRADTGTIVILEMGNTSSRGPISGRNHSPHPQMA